MPIKITAATPRLARAIDDVFVRTWLGAYPNREAGISERDVSEHFAKRKSRLERRRLRLGSLPENEGVFVAKERNRVPGMCVVKKDGEKNELQAIYVLPEHQGKGIGKLLWQRAVEFFDSELPVVLQVARYNESAISFYERLGFSVHAGKFHTKDSHALKNGKEIPVVTMVLERLADSTI